MSLNPKAYVFMHKTDKVWSVSNKPEYFQRSGYDNATDRCFCNYGN